MSQTDQDEFVEQKPSSPFADDEKQCWTLPIEEVLQFCQRSVALSIAHHPLLERTRCSKSEEAVRSDRDGGGRRPRQGKEQPHRLSNQSPRC